jgi:hypothetical protein
MDGSAEPVNSEDFPSAQLAAKVRELRAARHLTQGEARNPARVMPIWMVDRNWLGSRARRATSRPRPPCWSRRCNCPSRSEISATSVPANAALTSTSTTTSATWGPDPVHQHPPRSHASIRLARLPGPTRWSGQPIGRVACQYPRPGDLERSHTKPLGLPAAQAPEATVKRQP